MNALLVAAACVATAAGTVALLSGWSRLRFRRQPGAFRCRLGPRSRWWRRSGVWRIRRTRAVWVNDVLLIQSGLLRLGVTPVCPQLAEDASVQSLEPLEVRGLGPHTVALRLTDADGCPLLVATSAHDRGALVGPFLLASLPGLPRAPREHGV